MRLVEEAERRNVNVADSPLATAVAHNYFRLLACKDEYEVARLLTQSGFLERVRAQMTGPIRLHFHLAPPLLARRDPASGRPRKVEFGPWIIPVLRLLARLRFLRGTPLDPFRRSADRRLERELIRGYESLIEEILPALNAGNHAIAVELAALPGTIRGFGPVKAAAALRARMAGEELLQRFRDGARSPGSAAG